MSKTLQQPNDLLSLADRGMLREGSQPLRTFDRLLIEVYCDKAREYRWRLVCPFNGRTIGASCDGFTRRYFAIRVACKLAATLAGRDCVVTVTAGYSQGPRVQLWTFPAGSRKG